MKTIVIGDIHGRTIWKEIVKQDYDKVIFIGDYLDSKEGFSAVEQKHNLKEIIQFKKDNPDKVVLLVGNHDFHYFSFGNIPYSGFQPVHRHDYQEMLHAALDEELLQACCFQNSFLFTHAGVTKTWAKSQFGKDVFKGEELEILINEQFKYKPLAFEFTMGSNFSNTGDDVCQTPIWVRPASLKKDAVEGLIHVVGHTVQQRIAFDRQAIFIDALMFGEYLVIEDGVADYKTIEKEETT